MRIINFKATQQATNSKNLQPIHLQRLGSVVALVGPNGSGKSRILDLVKRYVSVMDRTDVAKTFEFTGNEFQTALKANDWGAVMNIYSKHIKELDYNKIYEITQNRAQVNTNRVPEASSFDFENFLNQKNPLLSEFPQDPFTFMGKSGIDYINSLGTKIVKEDFWIYKKTLERENANSKNRLDKLNYYINLFLGRELIPNDVTPLNSATLTGQISLETNLFSTTYTLLSPGQKILLNFAYLFFLMDLNPQNNIKESIFILDEPEKHLHPVMQIKLINGIRSIIGDKGQLWIATHSVNILSHLKLDEIFFLESGKIINPGRETPGKALASLMEIGDDIEKLKNLLLDQGQWEYVNFITECFEDSDEIKYPAENDSEIEIFKKIISYVDIVMLDFGAGKGRLGRAIQESPELSTKIEYYALVPGYNVDSEINELLTAENVFPKSELMPPNTFDIVVMCGVLHEMDFSKWRIEFTRIKNSLKPDGALFIIEDLFFPKGEHPNEHGYIVLNSKEIGILFGLEKEPIPITTKDPSKAERIQGTVITKSDMKIPDDNTILMTFEEVKNRSLQFLRSNQDKRDIAAARKYAFFSQQYINVTLALENLDPQNVNISFSDQQHSLGLGK